MKFFPNVVVLALLFGSLGASAQPLPFNPEGTAAREKLAKAYVKNRFLNSCSETPQKIAFTKKRAFFLSSHQTIDFREYGVVTYERGVNTVDWIELNFNNFTINHPYEQFFKTDCTIWKEECEEFLVDFIDDLNDLDDALTTPNQGYTLLDISYALTCLKAQATSFLSVLRKLITNSRKMD